MRLIEQFSVRRSISCLESVQVVKDTNAYFVHICHVSFTVGRFY